MSLNYREFNPNLDHTQVEEVTDFLDTTYRKYTNNEDRLGRAGLKRIAETICTYPDEFIEFITKLNIEDDDEVDDEDEAEDDDEVEEKDEADDEDEVDEKDDDEVEDDDEVDEVDSTDALKEEGIKPINGWSWIWIQGIY